MDVNNLTIKSRSTYMLTSQAIWHDLLIQTYDPEDFLNTILIGCPYLIKSKPKGYSTGNGQNCPHMLLQRQSEPKLVKKNFDAKKIGSPNHQKEKKSFTHWVLQKIVKRV